MRSIRARLLVFSLLVFALAPGLALASGSPFSDGFESGGLSAWTKTKAAAVQQSVVFDGGRALQLKAAGSPSWVRRSLGASGDLYAKAWFRVESRSTQASLLSLRSSSGARILTVAMSKGGKLLRLTSPQSVKEVGATGVSSSTWHELQVHAHVEGGASRVDVWFDNALVTDLSGAVSLGSSPPAELQVGDGSKNKVFTVAFDDVVADDAYIGSTDTTPPSVPQDLHTTSISSSKVSLDWSASSDATGVAGYTVFRDGVEIDTSPASEYDDLSALPGSSYAYGVDAYDGAGNHSGVSTTLTVDVPAAGGASTVMAAGDIACDPTDGFFNGGAGTARHCRARATSDLLVNGSPDAVLSLGDQQYVCGGYQAFNQSFDPSWGRVLPKLYPTPGNHEYETSGGTDCDTNAAGYFRYFGPRAGPGYYSFDVGTWHMVSLNSECSFAGGCGVGSPQEEWLEDDLVAHPASCTLAFWHEPRYGTKSANDRPAVDPLWDDLVTAGADVALSGHIHDYYRMAPLDASGNQDPDGMREFIVGTGGEEVWPLDTSRSFIQKGGQAFGVLELTLRSDSYDWEFVPAAGESFTDSGSSACH